MNRDKLFILFIINVTKGAWRHLHMSHSLQIHVLKVWTTDWKQTPPELYFYWFRAEHRWRRWMSDLLNETNSLRYDRLTTNDMVHQCRTFDRDAVLDRWFRWSNCNAIKTGYSRTLASNKSLKVQLLMSVTDKLTSIRWLKQTATILAMLIRDSS